MLHMNIHISYKYIDNSYEFHFFIYRNSLLASKDAVLYAEAWTVKFEQICTHLQTHQSYRLCQTTE